MAYLSIFPQVTISLAGTAAMPANGTLEILDPVLEMAPTAVVVSVMDAERNVDVSFSIDGHPVMTYPADSEGAITALSIPVSEARGSKGTHTLTATQGGTWSASATFEVLRPPLATLTSRVPDANPVAIPAANIGNGVHRWVLQDLMPGGLGSYVMPRNPRRWTPPYFERVLTARHTTAQDGQFHVTEGYPAEVQWSFEGYLASEEEHDALLAYKELNRRFYVIDHRNRAWIATFLDFDAVARLTQSWKGAPTEWGHDYTVTAVCYSQDPKDPL